jgi:putative glutamine amidotransferase
MEVREMGNERPVIGIAMRVEYTTDRFYLARFYSEAVEAHGGIPLHIPLIPNSDFICALVDSLDGILLPGSDSDVDPALYGQDPLPGLGSIHPIKDSTDLALLQEAEARNIPVLAICFGMQSLNVSRGGTLIQDLHSQLPQAIKHDQGTPRDRKSHKVFIREGSFIHNLAGATSELVNSHHHQAVDKLGHDLLATASTSDGVVEAMEDSRPDRWVVGVQWHPELGWADDPLSSQLFGSFVRACLDFKVGNSKENRKDISSVGV